MCTRYGLWYDSINSSAALYPGERPHIWRLASLNRLLMVSWIYGMLSSRPANGTQQLWSFERVESEEAKVVAMLTCPFECCRGRRWPLRVLFVPVLVVCAP